MSALSTHGGLQCPRCGAHARPGADWCTLCYADMRPAPEPDPEPTPEQQSGGLPTPDPGPGPAVATVRAGGKHARRDGAAPADDEAGEPGGPGGPDVDHLLALLAAETRADGLAGIGARLDSLPSRMVVMTGGLAVVGGLLLAVMVLAGSLL